MTAADGRLAVHSDGDRDTGDVVLIVTGRRRNPRRHASLIARECGIPAVVGTGNATARLHPGQRVTVNGTGTVTVQPP